MVKARPEGGSRLRNEVDTVQTAWEKRILGPGLDEYFKAGSIFDAGAGPSGMW